MISKASKNKTTYSNIEVSKIHNRYRIAIIIILAGFLWIIHSYGVADSFLKDITGGAVKITDKQSFWSLLLMIGKWVVSAFAIVFGLLMAWTKLIKKK